MKFQKNAGEEALGRPALCEQCSKQEREQNGYYQSLTQCLHQASRAVAVSIPLHVKPQMLFSSTFTCSPLVRNTGSFVYRKPGV